MNQSLADSIFCPHLLEGKVRFCVRGPGPADRVDYDMSRELANGDVPRNGEEFYVGITDGRFLRLALVRWIDSSTALCIKLPDEPADA